MIRLLQLGTTSVHAPTVPWNTMPTHNEATVTVTETIPRGTVLFAAFTLVWPERYDEATWDPAQNTFTGPQLPPVYDSQGHEWRQNEVTFNTHRYQLWWTILETPLTEGDTITATCLSEMAEPENPGHYSYSRTRTMGMRVFGFQCLADVLDDQGLTGYGETWVAFESREELVIDTTPFGGTPYSPRLQIVFLGTGYRVDPDPVDPLITFTPFEQTLPRDTPPTASFATPEGYELIGDVTGEVQHLHDPTPFPFGDPDYPPELGPVDQYFTDSIYYRFVPAGTVEDEIRIPGIDFGTGNLFYVQRALWTFRCREVPCPGRPGVDLLQTQNLHLFRASVSGAAVRVERSQDGGATWPHLRTLANDAGTSTVPTLTRDRGDNVWCWYHNAAGDTQSYVSYDLGETWSFFQGHPGQHYPRAAPQLERLLVITHDGTHLRLFESRDDGFTLAELPGTALACPEQLAAFRVDRRGTPHVVYWEAGGQLLHRQLELSDTWSGATALAASGGHPAFALGIYQGLLLYWDGGVPQALLTDPTYGEVSAAAVAPSGFAEGYLGALVTRQEADHVVCGVDAEGAVLTRISGDEAASWHAPA